MSKISTSDFKKGIFIEFRGEAYQIVDFKHVNPGKGGAFVRTKLKSLKGERFAEFTFKAGDSAKEIPVNVREMQYLYQENELFVFMDKRDYEQLSMSKSLIGDFHKFLKEGTIYQILVHEDRAVGMRYPKKVELLVVEAEDAVKGSTTMGAKKIVTVETGIQLAAPLFINKGDLIAIDPETGEYQERLSKK